MSQDNDPQFDITAKLEHYKRLLDVTFDAMTIDDIKRLIAEIESQIAKPGD